MDVREAIQRRRSIRPLDMDEHKPVERSTLASLFEAANWAPSHGLTEPWRFVVFEGDARRALVSVVLSTMVDEGQPPLPDNDPRVLKTTKKMLTPPVVCAIVCQASPLPKIYEHEEMCSVAMAVQNMHLLATDLGLGMFWTSGKKAFDPRVARFLELEPPARCLGFLYIGWPKGTWPEGERRPWEDKISFRS